jgi:inosine-uridine nucleoside N-ribohydrolase
MFLKEADKFVKEGNYKAALESIVRARKLDPGNQYALAYEERVRALMKAAEGSATKAQASPPPVEPSASAKAPTASSRAPSLTESQRVPRPEILARRKQEEQRKEAILTKIATLLARAREYQAKNEFSRALDEISRAYLLDPANKVVSSIEQEIRSAQEDVNRKEAEERRARAEIEERIKQEQLRAAMERVQHEQEEKRLKEEEARTVAQRQKVTQYLNRSRELLAEGKIQEAQSELAFVAVVDPLNQGLVEINNLIAEKQEELRQAELELYRKKEEEHRKKQDAIKAAVQKHLDNASSLAAKGKFSDALRVLTRAYVLDPTSEDLQKCEASILSAQEEASRQLQVKRREEEAKKKILEEEELRRREQAERERMLQGEAVEAEAKRRADDVAVQDHLKKAGALLAEGKYEGALAEIALAFIVNPFHEEVKQMEQEVLAAQAKSRQAQAPPVEDDMLEDTSEEETRAAVDEHLGRAREFRDRQEFVAALDEIAKAFILDPLNDSIQKLEDEIQQVVSKHQDDEKKRKEEESSLNALRLHVSLAQEFLEQGSFDEALREVQDGLAIDPSHDELKKISKAVQNARAKEEQAAQKAKAAANEHLQAAKRHFALGEFQKSAAEAEKGLEQDPSHGELQALRKRAASAQSHKESMKAAAPKADPVQEHLAAAKDLASRGSIDEALAEIALGLAVNPDHEELKQLEAELWEKTPEAPPAAAQGDDASKDGVQRRIKMHLLAAEEFVKHNDFGKALDEVAKAYVIDPLNTELRQMEIRIRQQEARQQQSPVQPLKLVYRKDQAADGTR